MMLQIPRHSAPESPQLVQVDKPYLMMAAAEVYELNRRVVQDAMNKELPDVAAKAE